MCLCCYWHYVFLMLSAVSFGYCAYVNKLVSPLGVSKVIYLSIKHEIFVGFRWWATVPYSHFVKSSDMMIWIWICIVLQIKIPVTGSKTGGYLYTSSIRNPNTNRYVDYVVYWVQCKWWWQLIFIQNQNRLYWPTMCTHTRILTPVFRCSQCTYT